MLNRAGFFRLRIVQKKIWKCGLFFVSLGGWRERYNQAGKIKFVYVRNFSYICISEILFITPNDIYESK